jgi:hypothetical protein
MKGACNAAPLAEVKYWRARKHALSTLYDQLQIPMLLKAVAVVSERSADKGLVTTFASQCETVRRVSPLQLNLY